MKSISSHHERRIPERMKIVIPSAYSCGERCANGPLPYFLVRYQVGEIKRNVINAHSTSWFRLFMSIRLTG